MSTASQNSPVRHEHQREFDLRLPSNRPLLPMKAAMVFLDRDEDQVLNLIDLGFLMWAFDIRRQNSEQRREVRVLRKSLIEYASGQVPQDGWRNLRAEPATKNEWNEVVGTILPKRDVRAFELARLFTCSRTHIHRLLDGKELVATAETATKKFESPLITRASIVTFLSTRRIH